MPSGEIISSIRVEHKAGKRRFDRGLKLRRCTVKSHATENSASEITSSEVTSTEIGKNNVGKACDCTFQTLDFSLLSLSLSLSARGVHSMLGNKFKKKKKTTKTKMQQITHHIAQERSERPQCERVERVGGKRGEKFQFQEHYYFH